MDFNDKHVTTGSWIVLEVTVLDGLTPAKLGVLYVLLAIVTDVMVNAMTMGWILPLDSCA